MEACEPSTSTGKRKQTRIFDIQQVLALLEGDDDDHLSLYSESGSEYIYSGSELDTDSDTTDTTEQPVKKKAKAKATATVTTAIDNTLSPVHSKGKPTKFLLIIFML